MVMGILRLLAFKMVAPNTSRGSGSGKIHGFELLGC